MKKTKDFLLSLLTSGKHGSFNEQTDLDDMLRLLVLNVTYTIVSVLIISLGVIDMQNGYINIGLIQLILGFMIFLNLMLLRTELPYMVGGIIVTIIFGFFCVLTIFTKYDLRGMNILWIYVFPLMSIYALGLIAGVISAIVLFGFTVFATFAPGYAVFSYDIAEAFLVCGVYLLLLVLTALYEYIRSFKDKEILEAKWHAEQANRAKSTFLANMSHEIRTPLNAIIGMTTIARDSDDRIQKENCLNKIESASVHLLGIINDILDMSKIEENKFELSYTEFEFSSMIQRVLNIFEFRLNEKKQHLAIEQDPSIPVRIISDEQRLAQVITNLIGNSIKFTPGKGDITFSIKRLEDPKEGFCALEIRVTDTGIGISKEQQGKLFQSFVQVDSSIARKFGGTGLGLAISKRIVELMNGDIRIESEIDKGASFIFTIHAEIPAELTASKTGETNIVQKERSDFSGKRILLVEDVEINREIVLTVLEPFGIEIIEAGDGKKAFDIFREKHESIDLIFMDIHMPLVNGYQASKLIRSWEAEQKLTRSVPIIAMTANVFKEDVEKCLASGMDGHIGKPLDFDALVAILEEYLV